MSKKSKILKGIQYAGSILALLDQFVDVDRIIHISNAQGPQAKLIRDLMSDGFTGVQHLPDATVEDFVTRVKSDFEALPPAQKRARTKALKGKRGKSGIS